MPNSVHLIGKLGTGSTKNSTRCPTKQPNCSALSIRQHRELTSSLFHSHRSGLKFRKIVENVHEIDTHLSESRQQIEHSKFVDESKASLLNSNAFRQSSGDNDANVGVSGRMEKSLDMLYEEPI